MTKFGVRKPSIKRSVSARTTGRITRSVKRSVTPFYGTKETGFTKKPSKSVYNKIYKSTTVGINPLSTSSSRKLDHYINQNTQHIDNNFNFSDSTELSNLKIQGPDLENLPETELLISINREFINTERYKDNLISITNHLADIIPKEEKFNGLKRAEIIKKRFDQPVFQFDSDAFSTYSNIKLNMENDIFYLENDIFYLIVTFNNINLKVGEISPIKNMELLKLFNDSDNDNVTSISIKNYGGKYKKITINKDESISVRGFTSPTEFDIDIFDITKNQKEKINRINEFNETIKKKKLKEKNDFEKQQRDVRNGCLLSFLITSFIIIIPLIVLFASL
ncbi:hypothetical protein M5C72_07250 [Companilactobacillus allii]|uniref:Uncharacterized protein n=1 Tax=Companilactobacillus allii TaxID=1847728 RepID=A0A1P8Q4X3_9LACO|nr:hypothetical protein [Companilactobacillus allii]APX72894.1 hypothetical protein BTM29_10165 [Companilactobacillus allii]USQ67682.1 hypothetical protein M5C72_07250 [Companilactobacillus allii]